MTSIVSLDIETTGLDPQKDAIIEIGAVRFNGQRIEDEWSTLINPGRHIPENITQLTGIDDAMVRHAPRIADVLSELADFVGAAPVLGQNVRFDLGFLQRQRVLTLNPVVDTYELASVLLPTASRYNLGALGQLLGIPLPATHRALDDARVTHAVYERLLAMAVELPIDLLAEIVRLGEPLDWDGNYAFLDALRLRAREQAKGKRVRPQEDDGPLFEEQDTGRRGPPPGLVKNLVELDPEEVASVLEYGGPFSRYFDAYEQRPEQVEMLKAVTKALSQSNHLMVEAGTGVGKSFAYMVPAAMFAVANNTRVVISTNTINLQDQLIRKDVPDLRAALGLDFRAAILKGRSNYLCPRRLEAMRHHGGPATVDEMRVLAKVLVWREQSASGDRNELNLNRPQEKEVWMKFSAEDEGCSGENCATRMGGTCPFYRAKQTAQNAHILIVNHALLLSDVATGSKVLPEYQYLIIDEAHHLESATTGALSFRMSQNDFERMVREVGGSASGVMGRLLTETRDIMRPSDHASFAQLIHRASELAFRLDGQAKDFFYGLAEFIALQREGRPQSLYAYQERIQPHTRTARGWDNVELIWNNAGDTMRLLVGLTGEIYKLMGELYAEGAEEIEDALGMLSNLYRRLSEAEVSISTMIHEPTNDLVYWIEVQPQSKRLTLNHAPLRVGPLIQQYLWHDKECVILTSATLTAAGDFTYLRNVLMADEVNELTLGSPYDYESSTLLFIATDIPEPNAPGYENAINRGLIQLCKSTGGRTLVLFTSYAQLKRTSGAISGTLAADDIQVYEQGEGASPQALLEAFKSTERAVLLGTRAFWEGVDVPGDMLSVVVITKLPFEVPSDPLIAARSETFEDPFGQYQIPEAILKFRQGFGRLIRTSSDRGVVAIFDRRVMTKMYGKLFIGSLPQCTLRQGTINDLPKLAAKWLG